MYYITQSSEKYAILDIENKCDRAISSYAKSTPCYSLGIKGGLIDGNQSRGQFGYSLVDGCGPQHSLDHCYGYILGYNKGYGHLTNNTETWNAANGSGYEAGYQQSATHPGHLTCDVTGD